MKTVLRFLAFVLVCQLAGFIGSIFTTPSIPGWYAGLVKPSFNPPNWVFAPVWTLLYLVIAIAGWRTWQRGSRTAPMTAWFIQLGLNFIWSPVFFGAHRIGLALAIIVALLAAILCFIVTAWPRDHVASWLFMPYAAWVAFATLLNAALWHLN